MYIKIIVEKVRNCSLGAISPLFHNILYLILGFCVKTRTRFSLRDKRLFEIIEVEITRVDCTYINTLVNLTVNVVFNPIALRKAKIVCNFGLSECNRVEVQKHILPGLQPHVIQSWMLVYSGLMLTEI